MIDRDVSNRFTSGTVPMMMVHEEVEQGGGNIKEGGYVKKRGNDVQGRKRGKTRKLD